MIPFDADKKFGLRCIYTWISDIHRAGGKGVKIGDDHLTIDDDLIYALQANLKSDFYSSKDKELLNRVRRFYIDYRKGMYGIRKQN